MCHVARIILVLVWLQYYFIKWSWYNGISSRDGAKPALWNFASSRWFPLVRLGSRFFILFLFFSVFLFLSDASIYCRYCSWLFPVLFSIYPGHCDICHLVICYSRIYLFLFPLVFSLLQLFGFLFLCNFTLCLFQISYYCVCKILRISRAYGDVVLKLGLLFHFFFQFGYLFFTL